MDLNWILLWVSGVSTAVNLGAALWTRNPPAWGWRAILSAMLLLLGALWLRVPELTGFIVGPIWFVFVLLPGLLLRRVNRLLSRRKHRRAMWLAHLAALLHPCDGWPQQARLVRALALFDRGKTAAASELISRLGSFDTSLGRTARLIEAQQTGDWQRLLHWIDRRHSLTDVFRDEALLIARAQALGELGRRNEMLAMMGTVLDDVTGLPPMSRAILQMRVAALTGQVEATERQLSRLSEMYPADVRAYWRLTARQVAGEADVDGQLRQLAATASPYLKPMIERRLSSPLPPFDPHAEEGTAGQIINSLTARIEHDAEQAIWLDEDHRRPWATWIIAAGLVVNFLREIPGGGWNPNTQRYAENLIDLGALIIPQSETPGEWWRILSAGFLHFGPVHLGLNLLGLLVLAPRLERTWGKLPMVVCYLVTTFTSMALVPHVTRPLPPGESQILVGASGGMMGLLGGLIGLSIVNWLRHRNEQTRDPLMFLLLIVALQTSFDLYTPNVSLAAHTMGLLTGTVFGVSWTFLVQRRRERRSIRHATTSTDQT